MKKEKKKQQKKLMSCCITYFRAIKTGKLVWQGSTHHGLMI